MIAMSDTARQVQGFCRRHFNDVVLDGWQAVRLIGYGETAVDCYYVYLCPRRGVYWSSAVGGPATLDGLRDQGYVFSHSGEHWDNYTRLDSLLALNGAAKVNEFICDIRPDDGE
jgi:hypothetical protein